MTKSTTTTKDKSCGQKKAPAPNGTSQPVADQSIGIEGWQNALGNQAFGSMLNKTLTSNQSVDKPGGAGLPTSGQPLDLATRDLMESRFGHNFSHVRIHADEQAARHARVMRARAYTSGRDIVFGPGQYAPETNHGKKLLAHELAHVVQQSRGGNKPGMNPNAHNELDAHAAAEAFAQKEGPVTVNSSTSVGLALAVDDWLNASPNYQTWSYTELLNEIDEIQQWLGNQIESSEQSIRLEGVLEELLGEARKRERSATQRPRRPNRSRSGRGRNRRQQDGPQQDSSQQPSESLPPRPRILQEQTSVQYSDPAEMREEVDRIMAWLQREDLTRNEREILQTELQNLAPLLLENRVQRAAERRAGRIEQALTPTFSEDARVRLVQAVGIIESIRPMSDRPGFSYLMHTGEMIVLQDSEVEAIRNGVAEKMAEAARRIRSINAQTESRYQEHARLNYEEQPVVGFVISVIRGEEPVDIYDRQNVFNMRSFDSLLRFDQAQRQGSLIRMAETIANAEENAIAAKNIVDDWVEGTIETAGNVVRVLTITRDLSFSIVTSYFGGAGFLNLARSGAGLIRAGLTVTAASAGGNAVARGGTNLLGQALSGSPVNFGEVGSETLAGARSGTVDAVSTITGIRAAQALRVGAQGLSRTSNILRSGGAGAASGAAGSATNATLEGKSGSEVLRDTGTGAVTGFLGGSTGAGISSLFKSESATGRIISSAAGGGTAGIANAALSGGDISEGGAIGLIGGLAPSLAANHQSPTQSASRPVQRRNFGAIQRVRSRARSYLAATMIGVNNAVPLTRGTGGGLGNSNRSRSALIEPAALANLDATQPASATSDRRIVSPTRTAPTSNRSRGVTATSEGVVPHPAASEPEVVRVRRPIRRPTDAREAQPAQPQPSKTQQRRRSTSEEIAEVRREAEGDTESLDHQNDVVEAADEVRTDLHARLSESTTASERLRAALEEANIPVPSGHDAHHIVPSRGGNEAGDRARAILESEGVNLDTEPNGVPLPRTTRDSRDVPQAATSHQEVHTNRYFENLAAMLEAAPPGTVRDLLRDIRTALVDGDRDLSRMRQRVLGD